MSEPSHITFAGLLKILVSNLREEKERTGEISERSFDAADYTCGQMVEAMPVNPSRYRP